MPPRKQIDEAAVIAGYRAGASVRQLARAFGVSHTVIHRRLVAGGVEMRAPATGVPVPAEVREKVADAYQRGIPLADIVATYGVCDQTVRKAADEMGIARRPPGGQPRLRHDQIEALDGQGWPAEAIALMVGGSLTYVRTILRRARQADAPESGVELVGAK